MNRSDHSKNPFSFSSQIMWKSPLKYNFTKIQHQKSESNLILKKYHKLNSVYDDKHQQIENNY